jgi:hypothetical protein
MKSSKKPGVVVNIIKEDKGYGATAKIGDTFIATNGDSFDELKVMIVDAVNLAVEDEELQYSFDEFELVYDMESFFSFYKVINAKALSKRIGMNQSLLSQYISGIKKPSSKQTNRILREVQQIGKELSEVRFLL